MHEQSWLSIVWPFLHQEMDCHSDCCVCSDSADCWQVDTWLELLLEDTCYYCSKSISASISHREIVQAITFGTCLLNSELTSWCAFKHWFLHSYQKATFSWLLKEINWPLRNHCMTYLWQPSYVRFSVWITFSVQITVALFSLPHQSIPHLVRCTLNGHVLLSQPSAGLTFYSVIPVSKKVFWKNKN